MDRLDAFHRGAGIGHEEEIQFGGFVGVHVFAKGATGRIIVG
jgi:hypothetical protein